MNERCDGCTRNRPPAAEARNRVVRATEITVRKFLDAGKGLGKGAK